MRGQGSLRTAIVLGCFLTPVPLTDLALMLVALPLIGLLLDDVAAPKESPVRTPTG